MSFCLYFPTFWNVVPVKEEIVCNVGLHGLKWHPAGLGVWTLNAASTTFICQCGETEASLISLACLWSTLKLSHQPLQRAFSLSLRRCFFKKSLFPLFSHISICLPMILCLSFPPLPPPPRPPRPPSPRRHLRSISVFSPPSMWSQPFSHPTSSQTYSAYRWSSKRPQVDFYLIMHDASSQLQPLQPLYFLWGNLPFGCWTQGTDTMACFQSL